MTLIRYSAKRDENEKDIINALRQVGASVEPLSKKGVADLLVGYKGKNILIEVKQKRGKLTSDQQTWHDKWRGEKPYIVHNIEEALEVLKLNRTK